MSKAQLIAEIEALPEKERIDLATRTLRGAGVDELKAIQRALRRQKFPEVPEEVWEGFEDCEDGRTVDMETALFEEPPPHLR